MSNKLVFPQVAVYTPSEHDSLGLTKLELYAAMALQGMLSANNYSPIGPRDRAYLAVKSARALVEELEAEEGR